MEQFEEKLHEDLHQFLLSMKEVDEKLPECPDVEEKWEEIAKAYIPDGIREFQEYPSASLGWMMYIGMAVAKYWDSEWEIYSKLPDLYAYMRDKRGYDSMDEYIREEPEEKRLTREERKQRRLESYRSRNLVRWTEQEKRENAVLEGKDVDISRLLR